MTTPPSSLATVPWVAELRTLVHERLGYELPEHRLTREVAPRVLAHAEASGHRDPRELVASLRGDPAGADWEVVVQVVTVGETYFFRHPEQLRTLAGRLRSAAERLGRPLAVWSAGCASGEEPYSLAMLLEAWEVPFRILGTDVDAAALDRARAATGYSDRSVSHLPPALREQWLEAVRPGRWRLVERERLGVRFAAHNLVHEAPMRPLTGGWDAILCRNVLLYFDPEAGASVVEALARSLDDAGELWLGPCDLVTLGPERTGLAWHHAEGERFLARGEPTQRVRPPMRERPPPAPRPPAPTTPARLVERGLHATARRAVEESLEQTPDDGELLVLLGAFHLREHAFDEALTAFERAEPSHPRPAGLSYLRGVAHLKAGRETAAATAFGAALEEHPDDWASSCQLALLYRRSGRALREEVMLLRTLDRMGADTPRAPGLGVAAQLVNSVHSDPEMTRREVTRRLGALGATRDRNGRAS